MAAAVTTAATSATTMASLCSRATLAYAPRMAHVPDDSALMLRYKDGDIAAFETLYRRHNDALYRYLLRLCRHRESAEDIFQELLKDQQLASMIHLYN